MTHATVQLFPTPSALATVAIAAVSFMRGGTAGRCISVSVQAAVRGGLFFVVLWFYILMLTLGYKNIN